MYSHLPAPIINYIIFFLQFCLSFQSSPTNPFSPISPLIPSAQVSLGLPRFLLPGVALAAWCAAPLEMN
jgi:hypothetical protein